MDDQETESNNAEEQEEVTYQEEFMSEATPVDEQPITDIDEHKLFAAMSYLGVLVLIPLFVKKDDSFAQFHAKQGLVILIGFGITFLTLFLSKILANFLFLLLLLASVIGLVQSLQGRRWKIPAIGDIADKFSI